jgi:hypothetical protein
MNSLSQIPTDYKKFLDMTVHKYLPKVNKVRTLYNTVHADSGKTTFEYVRQTQSYAEAKGWTSFTDPTALADGSRPKLDSMGTEDASSTPTTYAKAYRLDRKILNSGDQLIKEFVGNYAMEKVNIIENYVNRTLITNMASNASQTYSASATWATTGDPVADIISAKTAFKMASGGMDADFLLVHPNEYADVAKDQRFQSTLYTTKSIETGEITPKPLGLDVMMDSAVTTGSFFLGKKGMFADLIVTEDYVTTETDEGLAGKVHEIAFTFVDQYKMPYYLMYGTGI